MQRESEWAMTVALGMRGDGGMSWGSGSGGRGKNTDLRETVRAGSIELGCRG